MESEREVARHYATAELGPRILEALAADGKNVDRLTPSDLSGADEFHLGWRAATADLAEALGLAAGMHVLDVGSGIGGPARHVAEAHGCRVTGVDLTEEYVAVATELTRRCGLDDRVVFRQGSATALPFEDDSFDAATLIHVGMNIADKATAFAEVHRVLRPGARFGVYDVVRIGDGDIPYPTPWAATAATSFVGTLSEYRDLLAAAGFAVERERDRRDFALAGLREMREKAAAHGPPPLGLHLLMGPASRERLGNVKDALERGTIAPVEFITRAL